MQQADEHAPTPMTGSADALSHNESNSSDVQQAANAVSPALPLPKEIGGRDGLEPTRFGDWEKAGRCIDF